MKLPLVGLIFLHQILNVVEHGSLAMELAFSELALVDSIVCPLLDALSGHFSVDEFSRVARAITHDQG
jgi:hypothetical protein